ncbi:MAG: hypothetical protein V8S95_08395 [Odoribacter sp.]
MENVSYSSVSSSRGKPEARIIFDQYLMGIYDVNPNNITSELNNFAPQNTTSLILRLEIRNSTLSSKTKN